MEGLCGLNTGASSGIGALFNFRVRLGHFIALRVYRVYKGSPWFLSWCEDPSRQSGTFLSSLFTPASGREIAVQLSSKNMPFSKRLKTLNF